MDLTEVRKASHSVALILAAKPEAGLDLSFVDSDCTIFSSYDEAREAGPYQSVMVIDNHSVRTREQIKQLLENGAKGVTLIWYPGQSAEYTYSIASLIDSFPSSYLSLVRDRAFLTVSASQEALINSIRQEPQWIKNQLAYTMNATSEDDRAWASEIRSHIENLEVTVNDLSVEKNFTLLQNYELQQHLSSLDTATRTITELRTEVSELQLINEKLTAELLRLRRLHVGDENHNDASELE